jgi:ABC-type transport system involved in multi-copper enzyme maturation permease subunit
MDPLVKKEIRMLLPAWIAAMLLALVQGVTRPYDFYVASLLFLGLTLMALTSFGREASLNTFSSLLAQPVARLRLWQVKLSVLAAGFVTVFLAWLAAFGLAWANSQVDVTSAADSYNLFITVCLIATATFTGGLWTALLLRQVAGAFWLTLLVPAMLSGFSGIFLANSDSSSLVIAVLSVVIGAYSIGGFFFARRLFFRAQDIGWSGGVLAMPEWRWRSVRAGDDTSTRSRKPVFALIKKELFLHQSTLVGALVLLIVHAVLIVIRTVHTFDKNSPGETAASLFTVLFWICWVALAPVTGAEAVAEERRLGVMDGQLCQPYSRRMQFAVKAILTLLLAVFLGGCMPLFLELTGAHFGRAGSLFTDPAEGGLAVGILALAAWLGLIGFFASTLAKSFLQAVGFSVGTFIACTLLVPVFTGGRMLFLDSIPGPHILPLLLAVPTIIVTLLVLAYLNFSRYRDDWGLWRRNAGGLAGAIIFIFAGSNAIYHRAWEVFEPAEPAHGSARLTRFDPADLRNESFNNLLVRLPDGRVWFDFVNNRGPWSMVLNPHFIWELLNSLPHSAGPQQYIAGTNWLDASARHVDEMVPSYKEDHGSVRIVGYAAWPARITGKPGN